MKRLADLEVFQRQKEQLMSEMKTLEKQLVSQEEEHQAAIHRLEIEVLMEKERLGCVDLITVVNVPHFPDN